MNDVYNTVTLSSTGLYREKGSRFISFLYPVNDENEIKEKLAALRKEHHSARHHCYAWRLGIEEVRSRANDDGEPSSTAGKPILGQLDHYDLTNVLLVVVRYFGGTLLGVSGLIQAYREAAADAIRNAVIETRIIESTFEIECAYPQLNQVMHIIRNQGFKILDTQMMEKCRITFAVQKSDTAKAVSSFGDTYGITFRRL